MRQVPELTDHIYESARSALTTIPTAQREDIYVVSLFVYDEDDDPRKPTVTVGYNSEVDVARSVDPADPFSADEQEARWNYAFWRQNELALICDTQADAEGARLREAWARQKGLWYELPDDEDPAFNERGEALTKAFISLLEGTVAELQSADIAAIFGRRLPVLIHELEYYDEIAAQNLRANPPGVVPDDFVRWCQGA